MRKNKKIMKRLVGVLITIVMMIGMMTTTAFAADGSATITITRPANITTSLKDMEVKAYMVLDQVDPNVTDAAKKQYTVTDAFRSFFNINEVKTVFNGTGEVYLKYDVDNKKLTAASSSSEGAFKITDNTALDATYPEADLVGRITDANNIATFYTWIEKYIKDSSITETETVTATEEGTVSFSNLREGYYALRFFEVPDGISVKQGILVATLGDIELKAEPIPVNKTVSADDGGSYSDAVSAAMDQILKYKITTNVPNIKDYSNLTEFKLTDTYEHQKLVQTTEKNFQLKVGTKVYTLSTNKFVNGSEEIATLDTTTSGQFIVDFDTDILANYQGEDVELTYYAQLTSDAININGNSVTLSYTNNGSTSVETDSTEVYTYGIDVQKTFSSSVKPYSGVHFALYTDNKGSKGSQIALVRTADGVYHVPAADDTSTTTTDLVLDSNGKLTITGLDVGTYWLDETSVPDGYTEAQDIKITLAKSSDDPENLDETGSSASYGGTGQDLLSVIKQSKTNISLGHFEVLNQKGFNLPQTGGAGTWMLTIGGIVLIAVAAGLFVASRRKASK